MKSELPDRKLRYETRLRELLLGFPKPARGAAYGAISSTKSQKEPLHLTGYSGLKKPQKIAAAQPHWAYFAPWLRSISDSGLVSFGSWTSTVV